LLAGGDRAGVAYDGKGGARQGTYSGGVARGSAAWGVPLSRPDGGHGAVATGGLIQHCLAARVGEFVL
jgi:hypothetical protein